MSGIAIYLLAFLAQLAKQGDAAAVVSDPKDFHSPMIIETVFAPADPSLWVHTEWTPQNKRPWKRGGFTTPEYHNLGSFRCDGLSIRREWSSRHQTWESGLTMNMERLGNNQTQIDAEVTITNPGHGAGVPDKVAKVLLEVLRGDEVIATGSFNIKVRANWRDSDSENEKRVKIFVPTDALKKDDPPKLRITMTTKDY